MHFSHWRTRLHSLLQFMAILLFTGLVTLVLGAEEEEGARRALTFWTVWGLPRVWVGAILAFIGLVLLMTRTASKWVRLAAMVVVFFAFSIVAFLPLGDFANGMDMHPSPMCTIEKAFMFNQMGRAVPIVFFSVLAFILLLTLVANKSFCGWNCPIGAIQEMLHAIPLPGKWRSKLSFRWSNTLRMVIFLGFIAFLYGLGFSIYVYLNPFEFLHWSLEWTVIPAFVVTFLAALFIYRPFCYLVCPVGLLTWLVEHVSILRVRLDKEKCTMCMRCVKESPCPTVPSILEGKKSRPDCHACGACIQACPEDALRFK